MFAQHDLVTKFRCILGPALCLSFACSGLLTAQVTPSTTLSGTVSDQTGATVPRAAVELVNVGTQFTKHSETDDQGRFLFSLVPPGKYDLAVTASGFATYRQSGITLDVNVPATVPITLSVSGTAEQVTVQADAPMVDSQSGTVRQVVGEQVHSGSAARRPQRRGAGVYGAGHGPRQGHRHRHVRHEWRQSGDLRKRHHGQPGQLQA